MKKQIFIFFGILQVIFLSNFHTAFAQDVAGSWIGTLALGPQNLRVVFNIKQDDNKKLTATLDSPDQGAMDIPVESVTIKNDSIIFNVTAIGGIYSGMFNKDSNTFIGELKQSGMTFPLNLKKGNSVVLNRPQTPVKPYPYKEEEVLIENKNDNLTLSGTFTKPEGDGQFPVAIMITGSGPEDRDEAVFGHKPFLILSDYLTRRGFAILRCDDRGTGKSTGKYKGATADDFASDVKVQIDYLKTRDDIDVSRIGLIGHSEGGVIAPLVASERSDVGFIVMIAGPGINFFEILMAQDSLTDLAEGVSEEKIAHSREVNKRVFSMLKQTSDSAAARIKLKEIFTEMKVDEGTAAQQMSMLTSPWFRWYINYEPSVTLQKVKCPVLAVNGEMDVQVPAKADLDAIEDALRKGGNKNYQVVMLPGLNHVLQKCTKCSVSEYSQIEETMNPVALKTIGDWMVKNILDMK